MKITFLGSSHGYVEKNAFCTSMLLQSGEKNYLIDAGAPVNKLLLDCDVTYNKLNAVFITHDHDDHYLGLIGLLCAIRGKERGKGVDFSIYFPSRKVYPRLRRFVYHTGAPRPKCPRFVRYAKKGVIFDDGTIKVTAIPVKHIPHAHALMVECEGKKVLFSGDLRRDMPDYPKILFKEEFDLLVLEAAHTALSDKKVVDKMTKSKVKNLVINHIAPKKNPPEVIQALFDTQPDKNCSVAYDGRVVLL